MLSHRALRAALVCSLAALASGGTAFAQLDCTITHTDKIPLIDMGTGTYQGYPGLLYPGTNVRPLWHDKDLDRFGRTMLLNAAGQPDPVNGKIVLISIGNSAADLEFSKFIEVANGYFPKNNKLDFVNCAQFGMNADEITSPDHIYWHHVDEHVEGAGYSTLQVQAVWLKQSIANPVGGFPGHQLTFRDDLRIIVQIIHSKYPNVRAIYFTSRIYGGYGPTGTSPEPYAYEYGLGVKWLIEEQLSGSPALNPDPLKGPVMAPWLAWGPYMWADGILPRSDGLKWMCNEFQNDGRHLNGTGREKFAGYLLSFFNSDPTTKPWFVDCDLTAPDVFAKPPEVLDNAMSKLPGGELNVAWQSLDPIVGIGAVYDVVRGRISDLRADRGFQRASCLTQDLPDTPYVDTSTDLLPGQGWYYMIRGRDVCGTGTFGDASASVVPDPRDALDTVACTASSCGDGIIDPGEQCDAGNLGGQTCASRGYFGGTLACTAGCTFDTSGCNNCGDGDIDSGEQCDGAALGGQTCQSQGFPGGNLFCSPSCTFDTSSCTTCGDGDIDAGEQCDGSDLGGETCESQGYAGGTLACSSACSFDTASCTTCGDGDVDAGEQCDGSDLGGETCESQGYAGGTLACSASCTLDTSACTTE